MATISAKYAAVIRSNLKKGKSVTEAAKAKLAEYEANKKPPGRPKVDTTNSVTNDSGPTITANEKQVAVDFGLPQSEQPSEQKPFSQPPTTDTTHAPSTAIAQATSCPGGPDCAGCKAANAGGYVCATTGRTLYPPMSEEAAKAMGVGILTALGVVFYLFRGHFVPPNKAERDLMGKAIQTAQKTRPWLSFLGAHQDILLLGAAFGGYSLRAIMTPKPAPPNGPTIKPDATPPKAPNAQSQ